MDMNITKVKCPECKNIGAEFVREILRPQGSMVTFKCTKCKHDFDVEY